MSVSSKAASYLLNDNQTLTESAKQHALLSVAEILVGGPRNMLKNKVFPEYPKDNQNLMDFYHVIFTEKAFPEMRKKIFDLHSKILEPLALNVDSPLSAQLLGPGTVEPEFFLAKAKIFDATPPTLAEFATLLTTEFSMFPAIAQKPEQAPKGGNTYKNTFLPPPPIVAPPTDALQNMPPLEAAAATKVCVEARELYFLKKYGLTQKQFDDNIENLTKAYNKMLHGVLEMPPPPQINVDSSLYPEQFEEQRILSTATTTGMVNIFKEFAKPPELIKFISSMTDPVRLADDLREKAAKTIANIHNIDRDIDPTEQAIVQSAKEVAVAQMPATIVAGIVGPGNLEAFVFKENSQMDLQTIEARVQNVRNAFVIGARKSATELLEEPSTISGPVGTYREEFIKLVNSVLSKDTVFQYPWPKVPRTMRTWANRLSAGTDYLNLAHHKHVKFDGTTLKEFSEYVTAAAKTPPGAGTGNARLAVPYLQFITPIAYTNLKSKPTKDQPEAFKKYIKNQLVYWSSCAMTVRAVIIHLSRIKNLQQEVKSTGVGTFYTQPYNGTTLNAMAPFRSSTSKAAYVSGGTVEDKIKNMKLGDFVIIRDENTQGSEHVAMWMLNDSPKIGHDKYKDTYNVFEGGQADLLRPHVLLNTKNAEQPDDNTNKKTIETINGCSVGRNTWNFKGTGNHIMCHYKDSMTGTPRTKRVEAVFDLIKFARVQQNVGG